MKRVEIIIIIINKNDLVVKMWTTWKIYRAKRS